MPSMMRMGRGLKRSSKKSFDCTAGREPLTQRRRKVKKSKALLTRARSASLSPHAELAKQDEATGKTIKLGNSMTDEPERPQLNPYQVELEEGKRYAWCSCGRSKKQPFCDGSHAGTGMEPLMFTAERTETALLCGCKDTGDPPFCDGSHLLL